MRDSLKGWVGEILALSGTPDPDRDRLAWLANGVFGVAGACHLEALARCGGLFGRAIEAMGDGAWRIDAARLYAASMVRLLEGVSKAEESAVLASLEAMTKHLRDASAAG
jgi:D-serine dehydratase